MPAARDLDARLHAFVGGLPGSPADRWLLRLTRSANHGRLWLVLAGLLALRRGAMRRGALRGIGSMAITSALTNVVLKTVFRRGRPERIEQPSARTLRRRPTSSSFPSGHSASAAAFVTGVAMESLPAGAVLAPVGLAVGYSRVHVGVHYPGDVVAGLAVGAGVAAATQHWWRVRPTDPAPVRPTSEAPALPEGEGLAVAVNPRSGPDD